MTGLANTALGAGAGIGVVGNDNVAAGLAAGNGVAGNENLASGTSAGSNVNGSGNIASGQSSGMNVVGTNNTALGTTAGNNVSASRTISIGTAANANANDAIAIGSGATAAANNAIAIGSGAVNTTPNSVQFGAAGTPLSLTNVANGVNPNDAVNVSQLNAVSAQVTTNGVSIATLGTQLGNVATIVSALSLAPPAATIGVSNIAVGGASGSSLTGNDNTSFGASSGQNITGDSNTAIGAKAGLSAIGNRNIAIGLGAGGIGTVQFVQTSPAEAASRRLESTAVPATLQTVNTPVIGSDNVALGTSAGLGIAGSFSSTVALGTQAAVQTSNAVAVGAQSIAAGTSAVAFGSGAQALGNNSVAIGANSVASADNTVSVGAPGATRRITNVADGIALSDAATVGQVSRGLTDTQQQLDHAVVGANAGIAMAFAQGSAVGLQAQAGAAEIGVGTGYYQGQTALGVGITAAAKSQLSRFSAGVSLSPGYGNFGAEASAHWTLHHTDAATPITPEEWLRLGFSQVREIEPGREYQARFGGALYRISLGAETIGGATVWQSDVDMLAATPDAAWTHCDMLSSTAGAASPLDALRSVLHEIINRSLHHA